MRFGFVPLVLLVSSVASGGEFSDQLAAQLQRSFSRCEGATVHQRDTVVELNVPKFCTFSDGRGVSGSATFSELDGAAVDAPVRNRLRLVVVAKSLVFDSQQFDGQLLEGVVNDEGTLSVKKKSVPKVRRLPPRPGVRVVEAKAPQLDPISETARDVGRVVTELPFVVPALLKELGSALDAATFANNPELVAMWLIVGGTS